MELLDKDNRFGGEDIEDISYSKAKVAIFGAPFDGTSTWGKGADKAPEAIIKASHNIEMYDEELDDEPKKVGIVTLPNINTDGISSEVMDKIYKQSKKLVDDGKFTVLFGGEHSVSYGIIKAYKEKYPDLTVLQLDAHTDLRDSYHGDIFNHACIMARVKELGIPSCQVGIRSISKEEVDKVKKNPEEYNIFYAKDINNNEDWHDEVISKLSDNVFITIDLDGFDPSIMPATGTPEPGGLLWYPTLRFLKKVCKAKNIVGFDINELAPIPESRISDVLAARLTYKLIGYSFLQ